MPTRRHLLRLALPALASLAASAGTAMAHAIAVESTPASGAVVVGPEVAITIRFNGRIDHGRSRLTLKDPAGRQQPLPIAAELAPDTLKSEASGLKPGGYVLRWQVLAVDGHITRGDIPFRIKGP